MFVMMNDGGPIPDDQTRVAPVLCQRGFIFDLMSQSIPIALLHGATFHDSKVSNSPFSFEIPYHSFIQIITFVFEQGLLLDPRKILGEKFWACVKRTHNHLGALEQKKNYGNPLPPLSTCRKDCLSRKGLWKSLRKISDRVKHLGLLWCFILHCEALPLIPLRHRTIGSQEYNPSLDTHLRGDLLPKLFSVIDLHLAKWNLDLDLDGNIFTALLGTLLSDATLSLPQQLGGSLSRITILVTPSSDDPLHLESLRSVFPVKASHPKLHLSVATRTKLLPFHHDVFDEEFSLINPSSYDSEEAIERGALEFGKDTAFNDEFHWHNSKRHILPKHLGGEQAKPSDKWQRMKAMKRHHRFMSRLTIDAATLTGALGARFNRLTIVAGGTGEVEGKQAGHLVRHTLAIFLPCGPISVIQVKGYARPSKKEKPMSSKEKLLAEILAKKLKKDMDEQQEWWEGRLRYLSDFDLDESLRILTTLEWNPRTAGGWLRDEVLLYRLHLTLSKWISLIDDQDTSAVRDHYTVAIMRIVKELSESKYLTPAVHRVISIVLSALGFESFVTPPASQPYRPLCFEFVKLFQPVSGRPLYEFMHITEDPITWQLRLFGEFMDRSMGSKPDPRVSFEPDAWQRQVLDCLDKNESILVVGGCPHGVLFDVLISGILPPSSYQCRKDFHLVLRDGTGFTGIQRRCPGIHGPDESLSHTSRRGGLRAVQQGC